MLKGDMNFGVEEFLDRTLEGENLDTTNIN